MSYHIVVGEVNMGSDEGNICLPVNEPLADARIQQRRLEAGVGSDQQDEVGLFYVC